MNTEIQQHIAGFAAAASAMIDGSAKTMGQLLGAPVEFALIDVGESKAEAIAEGIHVSVGFDGALRGDSSLVLSAGDAATIVKIMNPGTEIDATDLLGEAGKSALSEAVSQMMTGAAAALSDGLGERIDISPSRVSINPAKEEQDVAAVVVTYRSSIAHSADSQLFWRIDRELAASLGSRWLAATRAPGDAAPAATTAPPRPATVPAAPVAGGVINSVQLDIAVELGNVAMTIGDLLHMGEGSVVTLDQAVGDKVVMLANGTPVASGEVVIVDGVLGFRVADLISDAPGA